MMWKEICNAPRGKEILLRISFGFDIWEDAYVVGTIDFDDDLYTHADGFHWLAPGYRCALNNVEIFKIKEIRYMDIPKD